MKIELSLQCLPPAFVTKLKGSIPSNATLKDHKEKLWHVKMEKGDQGLTITNGWQHFADEHSLEFGDFLVFIYDGSSHFDVKIFGKNGCKKESHFASQVKEEEDKETEQIPIRTTRASKQKYLETVLRRVKKSGKKGCQKESHFASQVKEEEDEETEKIPVRTTQASKQKYSETVLRSVKKSGSSEVNQFRFQTSSQEVQAFKAPAHLPPFEATITQSSKYVMNIPNSLVNACGIKLNSEVILSDQDGKKWPVKVKVWGDGRITLATAWSLFHENNILVKNDRCVFELVLSKGCVSKEMKVRIIRKGKQKAEQV